MIAAFCPRWLLTCQHETPTLADALATCRADLHASESARASLKAQLDHYIGQAIRARAERDFSEASNRVARETFHLQQHVLTHALADKADLTARILALEDEVRALEASHEDLTNIADTVRTELRELRAAVTIGAAQRRKGRR